MIFMWICPITLVEAINGGKINVPTLHGNVSVNVPAGSNTDTVMRLKGKGIKPAKGTAGDQYIKLKIMLPEKPDPRITKFCQKLVGRSQIRRTKR